MLFCISLEEGRIKYSISRRDSDDVIVAVSSRTQRISGIPTEGVAHGLRSYAMLAFSQSNEIDMNRISVSLMK